MGRPGIEQPLTPGRPSRAVGIRLGTQRALFLLLAAAAFGCGAPPAAAAQDSASAPAAEQPTAPVALDGVTLFNVRGVSAYPAERRAAAVADRIAALASDRAIPVESLTVRETPGVSTLVAAGRRVLALVDADGALEGVTRHVLAEVYRERVAEAVERYRHDREPEVLLGSVGRALAATLALVLALWLGRRFLRWLRATLDRRFRGRVPDLRYREATLLEGEQLWRGVQSTVRLAAALLVFLAGYAWLGYVLRLFPWTRGAGRGLSDRLLQPLAVLGAGALGFLPNLVFLVILALLTRVLLRTVRLFFARVGDRTLSVPGFEPDWAQPVDRIVRILVVAFALVVAYPYIPGSQSEAFKGITILLGLLFSIGSPSVIGNLVAGQSLAFRRAFKVGDRIRIGEHVGAVTQIRLLTTYLRSPKNEQIVIPNSLILNSEVVNYSTFASGPGLILHTTVGIGYETPWRQVEAMLLEAAARTSGIQQHPVPFVLQRALGDFAVEYELNAYSDDASVSLLRYSALHRNILDVFNEYGVQIMTPAYEGDPETPKLVPRGQWYAAPARPSDLARTGDDDGAATPA